MLKKTLNRRSLRWLIKSYQRTHLQVYMHWQLFHHKSVLLQKVETSPCGENQAVTSRRKYLYIIKGLIFQIPDVNLMKTEIMPIFNHLFDEGSAEYFRKEKLASFITIRET